VAKKVDDEPRERLRERLREAMVEEVKPGKAQMDAEEGTADEKRDRASTRVRNKRLAKLRAEAAVEQFAEARAAVGDDLPVPVAPGVHFTEVKAIEDGVELFVDGGDGDPHFRIFNPPTLVADPTGDIELNGQRFREDPLAALGQVVANYRLTEKKKARR
jgi:hypothetical protein